MRALLQRAEAVAREAQRRRVDALAMTWRELVPSALITIEGSQVIVAAKRLRKRWLTDSGLRFIGRNGR